MSIDEPITVLVLQEFRLRAADTDGAVARIVASSGRGREPVVPLLTSIQDGRNVATLRALHAGEPTESETTQRAALEPFVSDWQPPKRFVPRIAERSASPPSSYRLAVTESGINNAAPELPAPIPRGTAQDGTPIPLGLLWIGSPVGTHAGLLALLGSYDDPDAVRPDPRGWPLSFSRKLGVRIYEG